MKALCANLLIASLFVTVGSARSEDTSSVALTGLDGQRSTITMAELDGLPRVELKSKQHGVVHNYEGALLGDVLKKVDAPSGKAIHGAELADVVIVQARDGYTVALDLAGTDAITRPERVIIADRVDGAELSPEIGPFQLVVEGDLRPVRSVLMVNAITLKRVN
jgi:hypothetical protein